MISQLPDSLNLGLAVPAAAIALEAGLLLHDFHERGVRTEYKGDVDLVREHLGVHEGAVDNIHEFCQLEQPFVHVKERHVASGTSIEPCCCEFQFAHRASLIRFR